MCFVIVAAFRSVCLCLADVVHLLFSSGCCC